MSDQIRSLIQARQQWSPSDEKTFQSWYGAWAGRTGMDPNPDAPEHQYDYRSAYLAGQTPDADFHWPSTYKMDGHPNLIINGVNTKTGKRQ